ncbi:hypothetical protein GCM10017788_62110 [Amycolatopsis acidiphila]|nr:hypothetical protein GCM10017788_62110 [Amycolatopsis acidiphila]
MRPTRDRVPQTRYAFGLGLARVRPRQLVKLVRSEFEEKAAQRPGGGTVNEQQASVTKAA